MTFRTAKLVSYETFLQDKYALAVLDSDGRAQEEQKRQALLKGFPHSVVVQVAYPELDFSDRWCWEHFGPQDGECLQADSEYSACGVPGPHSHEGRWHSRWLFKTAYDFGYNEWYFASSTDRDKFLEFVPQICWGEHYPK
jgi:hypothetical protein